MFITSVLLGWSDVEGEEENRATSDVEIEHALPLGFLLKAVAMLLLLATGVAYAVLRLMWKG